MAGSFSHGLTKLPGPQHGGIAAGMPTTVAIDNTYFKSGVYLNDIVVLIGKLTYVGNTSMEVRIDTYREDREGRRYPINRAYFVMVCMGDDDKPMKVPPLLLENDGERMEWETAEKRRDLRLHRRQEGFLKYSE